MPTQIGIGFSPHMDAETAAKDAAFEAKTNLNEDKIDLAIVFSSIHYNPKKFLSTLTKVLSGVRIIGCSAAGLILPNSIQTRGISVLTVTSNEIKFGIGSIPNIDHQEGRDAGATLARSIVFNLGNHRRQGLIFFSDSSLSISTSFIYGIQEILGNAFQIVGMGSCDNFQLIKNFQIFNEAALQKSAVGLLIGGNSSIGIANRHGLKPLGKPRFIDKASGNVIYSIDGKKAFNIYDEYFGQEAQSVQANRLGAIATSYPLGILAEPGKNYMIRNAIDILSDGSIVCQGEIPVGSEIHLMISSRESIRQAAIDATQDALAQLSGQTPQFILVLESMSRLKLLGRSAFEEIKQIKNLLPTQTSVFGMYGHGEIFPSLTPEQTLKTNMQNESITVIAVA